MKQLKVQRDFACRIKICTHPSTDIYVHIINRSTIRILCNLVYVFLKAFLLDIFLIYISNVIPKAPYNLPLPCSPTHPLLLPGPGIPLYWGIWSSPGSLYIYYGFQFWVFMRVLSVKTRGSLHLYLFLVYFLGLFFCFYLFSPIPMCLFYFTLL